MILNQKGFTLIEALLALLITGTLSLISFPPLVKLYDGIKLNQAIALLQSDLNYIRQANMMPFHKTEPTSNSGHSLKEFLFHPLVQH